MIIRFLTSVRLTLVLLLALATIAIYGTIWPTRGIELEAFRYEFFYQSPGFRLVLLLLALNLIACTLQLVKRRWQEKKLLLQQLRAFEPRGGSGSALQVVSCVKATAGLRGQGYQVLEAEAGLLARKGLPSRWGVIIIHLSVLLIMAGSLTSGFGFVGTMTVYEGDTQGTVFDWQAQADTDLGFAVRLDKFEPVFYPISLQFAVINPQDGRQVAMVESREGETVELPLPGYRATIEKFDPYLKRLRLQLAGPDGKERSYVSQAGVKDADNTVAGHVLYPLAYLDPIIKQQRSYVTVFRPGQEPLSGLIEVNQPLVVDGYTIFQTAYGRDENGYFYSGFQVSRDPGAPLVWAGCVALMLGLLMNLCFVYRVIGVRAQGDVGVVSVLAGFRGLDRREELQKTLASF